MVTAHCTHTDIITVMPVAKIYMSSPSDLPGYVAEGR